MPRSLSVLAPAGVHWEGWAQRYMKEGRVRRGRPVGDARTAGETGQWPRSRKLGIPSTVMNGGEGREAGGAVVSGVGAPGGESSAVDMVAGGLGCIGRGGLLGWEEGCRLC